MQRRLFWFSAALGMLAGVFYGSWFVVFGPAPLAWAQASVVLVTIFFSLLVWRTGDPALGIAGLVPCLAVILTMVMWLQGGLEAPTIWWLVILPFAWMLAGSVRAGLALGVALMIVVALTPAAIAWFDLPNLASQSKVPRQQYVASIVGALVVFSVYVAFSLKLRRDLRVELVRAMRDLEASRDEALSASRVKARFLAHMSHEIRTPISGILGGIELLRSTALDARQQQIVGLQRQSLDNLTALLNDVLDFARLEAGRLEMVPVDLRDIAFDALELHAASAHESGLELTCSMAPGMPTAVLADPIRLRQILGNLVSNAVKFTSRGGVHIHIGRAAEPVPESMVALQLEVQDTGVGIAPEDLAGIFSAFARSEDPAVRRSGGTGLGLAICRELARLMGGELACTSTRGQGTTFTLSLSLARHVTPHPAALPRREAFHVLVVANYLRLVQHLQAQLRDLSVTCEVRAVPPTQAELHDARERGVDAVLLDERLLGAHGRDRLEQIVGEVGMPVLLLCGISSDSTLGAVDGVFVLYKPVRPRALQDGLRWAQQSRRQSALPVSTSRPGRLASSSGDRHPGLAGRVLLVEDNPVNQVMTQAMLERLGLAVVVAGDGQEALKRYGEQTFDAVLMDVQMPGMDGVTVTERLRAFEQAQSRARTPVVAVTGNPEPEVRARGHEAGMDDFLGKPFTLQQLEQVLVRWQPRLMPGQEAG